MGGGWVAEVLCRLMASLRSADTSFVVSSEDFGIENSPRVDGCLGKDNFSLIHDENQNGRFRHGLSQKKSIYTYPIVAG